MCRLSNVTLDGGLTAVGGDIMRRYFLRLARQDAVYLSCLLLLYNLPS